MDEDRRPRGPFPPGSSFAAGPAITSITLPVAPSSTTKSLSNVPAPSCSIADGSTSPPNIRHLSKFGKDPKQHTLLFLIAPDTPSIPVGSHDPDDAEYT